MEDKAVLKLQEGKNKMRRRQLKLWQKLGIIFGGLHLISVSFLFSILKGEQGMIIILIDLPLLYIGDWFFPKLYNNNATFAIFYHIILGSIFYSLVGALIGVVINRFKKEI